MRALACLCALRLVFFAASAGWALAKVLLPLPTGFAAVVEALDENQALSLENVSRIISEPLSRYDEICHSSKPAVAGPIKGDLETASPTVTF